MNEVEVLAVDEAHLLPESKTLLSIPLPPADMSLEDFIASLTDEQLAALLNSAPAAIKDNGIDLKEMFSKSAMASLAQQKPREFPDTPRLIAAQRPFHERYRYKPHNGAKEMARRRKQMADAKG